MIGLSATPMPAAQNGWPQIDIEWAPASVPLDAPCWRSMIKQADEVKSFKTKVGRPKEYQRFQTGEGSATLGNWSGQYDPEYTASPVYGMVLPNRQWRIVARISGGTHYLLQGYIDGWPEPSGYPIEKEFTLPVSDAFKVLARLDLPDSMFMLVLASDQATHWWPLDDTSGTVARDAGLLGEALLPAQYNGGVTLAQTGIVPYDGGRSCASFNGTSGYVSFQSAAPLASLASSTIFGWFTHPAVATNDRTLYYYGSPLTAAPLGFDLVLYIDLTPNTGKLVLDTYSSTTPNGSFTSASRVDDGAPHSWALKWDGLNVFLYVDGVLATGGANVNGETFDQTSLVGASNLNGSLVNFWAGKASTVALFPGALSTAQILELHNAGANAFLNETTGQRVNRILGFLQWPASKANVSAGNSTLQSEDLPGGQALDYFQTLYDTEQNYFYCDGLGRITWPSRQELITTTTSNTSQATFTDAAGAGGLHYASLLYDKSELDVYNDVSVTRNNGTTQRVTDPASKKKFLPQSFTLSGTLQSSDNDANDCANWILAHHKDPPNRIIGITFEPLGDTTLMIQCLSRKIMDRVTVVRTVNGTTISNEFIIEGIQHEASVTGIWVTTWWLNPADTQRYWILDSATNSVLDSTTRLAF